MGEQQQTFGADADVDNAPAAVGDTTEDVESCCEGDGEEDDWSAQASVDSLQGIRGSLASVTARSVAGGDADSAVHPAMSDRLSRTGSSEGPYPSLCDLANGHDPYGIDTIMHKEAPDGWHFALNPTTGKIGLISDIPHVGPYRPDPEAGKGDWHYGIDPRTGRVGRMPNVQDQLYRREDAEVQNRGWHYALNPKTGRIEQTPNQTTQLLDWRRRAAGM